RHSEDNTEATAKPPPPKPVERALVGKDLEVAVRELRSFLADIRRRLQRFFDAEGNPNAAALKQALSENDAFAISVRELLGSTPEEHEVETSQKLHDTATLVDTTLFRAYMFTNPRLAGSLFRISNSCDPDVVMEKLEETKRYNDLVDFLYGKKLHKRALEELRKFGQVGERKKPASQKDAKEGSADKHLDEYGEPIVHDLKPEEIPQELIGPKRTVAYLQHLPPSMIDLILEYAEWPIRADPQLGMEVFLADTENAEGLPRRRVLDFLLGIDKLLATRFLEHVIGELGDMEPALHQKLLDLYLGRLFELGRERGADEGKKGEDKAENGEESGKSETSSAKEDDDTRPPRCSTNSHAPIQHSMKPAPSCLARWASTSRRSRSTSSFSTTK
ncbi:Vacuolar morphogenesis protein 6, partial [Ascosphaera atra]